MRWCTWLSVACSVDTGSSDTWLAQKGFKCFNLTSYPEPEAECSFGSAGFSPSKSKTFKTDTSRNFNISYGDGEFLTGTVGFDTVTVANLSVTHQEIGVVTNAAVSICALLTAALLTGGL
jgi:hypothetical protein